MNDNEKRAVFVTQHFPPDTSGHASRMEDMTKNIESDGWTVTVLAPPPSFPPESFDRSWRRVETDRHDGVRVHRLWAWQPTTSDPGFVSRLSYYLLFAFHATLWLLWNRSAYDVVVTTTPPISTGFAGLATMVGDKKWVVDVRDLWIDASISLGFIEEGSLLERLSRGFQRRVLYACDAISVTTPTLGDTLASTYGDQLDKKIFTAPNGVDISEFGAAETAVESDRPTIVYTGNIGHAQDLDAAVRAMQYVSNDAVLRLVGGGDLVPTLKETVSELGLSDRVEFVGTVPREEIPELLQQAEIGIAPLADHDELSYAMPTKVYEYLGSRLPVVATGGGELERFIGESESGLHTTTDPQALADAFDTLLGDPARRRECGARGYEYVEQRYDRRTIAGRFREELDKIRTTDQQSVGDSQSISDYTLSFRQDR